MSALLRIEPPTDPQLAMIGRLCAEQGWTPPGAVYSKAEASEIIGGMLAATYDAELYRAPSSAPTYDDADFGEHAFANGWSMYDPDLTPADDPSVPF
jgi:hypothetical protein